MTSLVTTVADILEASADYVRAGWTQHRPFDHVDGQLYVCASGAMWLAAGLSRDRALRVEDEPSLALWQGAVACLQTHLGDNVAGWNDSIGQTQGHVADTLLQLAKELRNNGGLT
jgi:hypothetical protein